MARKRKPLSIGVLGFGHWGPNYVRNFSRVKNARVKSVCDIDPRRREALVDMFPHIRSEDNFRAVLKDPEINAVVIATPASTHHRFVKESLLAGKDVLCEKPLCDSADLAWELDKLARKRKKILSVGHVFRFNDGVEEIRKQLTAKRLGKVYYIHIKHTNLGPVRTDVNVVWDLAPHDISILYHVLGTWPLEVSATGFAIFKNKREDFAFISLRYPGEILCHLHVSWIEPAKIRQMIVVGEKKMAIWDDIALNPIEIHEKWLEKEAFYRDFGEFQLIPKVGPISIPRVVMSEPLLELCKDFIQSAIKRRQPRVSAREGVNNSTIIEDINKSIALRGKPIEVKYAERRTRSRQARGRQ